jgi:hypothetical protein
MARPLTSEDQFACPHGAAVRFSPSNLVIDGMPALWAGEATVEACPNQTPCTSAALMPSGTSVLVGGSAIAMDDCDTWVTNANQESLDLTITPGNFDQSAFLLV